MRWMLVWVLGGVLAVAGCDSDNGSGGSAGSAGTGGSGGGGPGQAPRITEVRWEPDGVCSPGTRSGYTVTVTASDPDSSPTDLIYDGSVGGCTGQIDAMISTLTCPNAAPYSGTVVVEDADGNVSAPASFTISICGTGSATP